MTLLHQEASKNLQEVAAPRQECCSSEGATTLHDMIPLEPSVLSFALACSLAAWTLPKLLASKIDAPWKLFDGHPIDGSFWPRIQLHKHILLILLICNLLLQGFATGWQLIHLRPSLADDLFLLVALLYMTLLTARYLRTRSKHAQLVWHLTALSFVTACLLVARLLPYTVLSGPLKHHTGRRLYYLTVAQAVLALITLTRAGTLPTGPPLWFDSNQHQGEVAQANVSKLVEASPFSFLLFGWVEEVINKGNAGESFNDLPQLTAQFRARNVYSEFSQPRAGSLLSRIIYMNGSGFTIQIALSVFEAFLYYVSLENCHL
jgi:hypothetical protein